MDSQGTDISRIQGAFWKYLLSHELSYPAFQPSVSGVSGVPEEDVLDLQQSLALRSLSVLGESSSDRAGGKD